MKLKLNDELETVLNIRNLTLYKVQKIHNKENNIYELTIQYRLNELEYHDTMKIYYMGKKNWQQAYDQIIDNI